MRIPKRILRSYLGFGLRAESETRKQLRLQFEESERELLVEKFTTFYLWLGVAAVLAFALVDIFLTPEHARNFLICRLLVIPLSAGCLVAYRFEIVRKHFHAWPALATSAYLGFSLNYFCMNSGYESSLHYMGLMMALSMMAGQIPWHPKHIGIAMLLVCGPFWGTVLYRWRETNVAVAFGDFMIWQGTSILTVAFYGMARKLRRTAFFRRLKLIHKNREQSVVIEQKTREGIYLERLASQFSPQVIDSIKSGTLDLDARTRRPVACIFVDVQNSTSRANRIDHHMYTDLMAAFFEECVKIFLRHNVTVGTYLGDGILAFTNAPTADPEYKRNALNACLEILALHERKRKLYFETWRTEFNIRIGIDSGYATVGFFPSREHGTYTALGETVSLAARLCARSELNAIALTKKYLTTIKFENSSLVISRLSTAVDIKGLEGESFEVYCVRAPISEQMPESHCPSCAVPMDEESVQVGASFYKCGTCGYRELISAKPELKIVKKPSQAA